MDFIIRVTFELYQLTRHTAGVPTWKARDTELVRGGGEPTVYGSRKFSHTEGKPRVDHSQGRFTSIQSPKP